MHTLLRAAAPPFLLALAGCVSAPERNPLPSELVDDARIAGVPGARFYGDVWPSWERERLDRLTDEEFRREFVDIYGKEHHYLALSGGGSKGAFCAGLLAGWEASGTRPEFTMVTGVSTGALCAPFAFLGPEYDEVLGKAYTSVETADIFVERGLIVAAQTDSLTSTDPLRELLDLYSSDELIDAIAVEHRRGRRLLVGTVNLDSGRPTIWNIGAIANSERADRAELIRDVLQASSAIPVAFPPVLIDVEADGATYDEMHVDGGLGAQVFVYPAEADARGLVDRFAVPGRPKVYVVRNSFLEPEFSAPPREVLPIALRSIDSMVRQQGIGDLYQIHALCQRDGFDFRLAYVPEDVDRTKNGFNREFMTMLWERGFEMAKDGYPWDTAPPGYVRP